MNTSRIRGASIASWSASFLLLLLASTSIAATPDGTWSSPDIGPGLDGNTSIFDPLRNRYVVFGGRNNVGPSSDVWAFSLDDRVWARLEAAGTPPVASSGTRFQSYYLPHSDEMLVIDNGDPNRIWTLSLSDPMSWRAVTAGGNPPSRSGFATSIDPEGRRLFMASGISFSHGSGIPSGHDDLWVLNLNVWQWSPLVDGAVPGRSNALMTFDSSLDGLLFHGGRETTDIDEHDLWFFHLLQGGATAEVTEVTPTDVPYGGVTGRSFVRDSRRDRPLLIGEPAEVLWQPTPGVPWTWTQIPATDQPSLPSVPTAVVYDSLADQIVFGNPLGVWGLPLSSSDWTRIWTPPWIPPPAMSFVPMVFDPEGNRVWLFGASTNDPTNAWALDFDVPSPFWRPMTANILGTPPRRRPVDFAAYDRLHNRIVYLTDEGEYALTLSNPLTWSRLTVQGTRPEAPQGYPDTFPGDGGAAILDEHNDRIVFAFTRKDQTGLRKAQTWALSLSDPPAWTDLGVAIPRPNVLRMSPMIYDAASEQMVGLVVTRFFDGTTNFDSLQVWQLSMAPGAEWHLLDPSPQLPAELFGSSAVYDPARRRMVVFGGATGSGPSYTSNAVDAFDLREPHSWTVLSPEGPRPEPRRHQASVYDPIGDRLIVFGGWPEHSDTWYLTWGNATNVSAICPESAIWSSSGETIHYSVANPTTIPQVVDLRLTSEREWPGFPLAARREIPPGTSEVALSFSAPDSAAPGGNHLELSASIVGLSALAAACGHELLDASAASGLTFAPPMPISDGVLIAWLGSTDGLEIAVERRGLNGDWVRLADFQSGLSSFEDHSAEAGEEYLYRLVLRGPLGELTSGAIHVSVSSLPVEPGLDLAIRPVQPFAEARFVVTLPHTGPARLELFDLGGRKVASSDLSNLTAGPHVVVVAPRSGLKSGMYVAKLEQDGAVRTSRCIVVR